MNLIDTTHLTPEAASLLQSGTPGAPAAGDIWSLSWNGSDLGLILLGYVQDTYVSALPVTLDPSIACIAAATVPADSSPLRSELVVWASAPNSIGTHLLSRRIGRLCSESDVRRMVYAAEGEDMDSPFPLSNRELDADLFEDVETIFNSFAAFADHDWVSDRPGDAVFDHEILERLGWDERTLAESLEVPPREAFPLFHGEKRPTPDQVNAVTAQTGLPAQEILMPLHVAEAVVLSQPAFKAALQNLASSYNIDERRARNIALQDSYALAARQPDAPDMEAARQRVIETLDRLRPKK